MATPTPPKNLILTCKACGHQNEFDQPYPYHAGFSDVGFLYNEAGNATLIWSAYDPYFQKNYGEMQLWPSRKSPSTEAFEAILPLSPKGDRWTFAASARCINCKSEISPPMGQTVNYLVYPCSINLAGPDYSELWLEFYIKTGITI